MFSTGGRHGFLFRPVCRTGFRQAPATSAGLTSPGAALAQQRGDLIRELRSLMARWEADVGAEAKERHLPTRSCRALTGSR